MWPLPAVCGCCACCGCCDVVGVPAEAGTTTASVSPTHRRCTIEIENKTSEWTLMNPRDMGPCSGCCGVVGVPAEAGTTTASVSLTHRRCTIEIENKTSECTLMNPRFYTYSGSCKKTLPDTISVSKSGRAVFAKTPHTACGSVGVFTYDLYQNSTKQNKGKMAVMFSNPYNFNLHSNWFAVGVFDMNKKCDYDLYNEMYNNEEKGFVRGEAECGDLTYRSDDVTIRATMSDSYQPVINLQVSKH